MFSCRMRVVFIISHVTVIQGPRKTLLSVPGPRGLSLPYYVKGIVLLRDLKLFELINL